MAAERKRPEPEAIEGLLCPKCQGDEVAELPSNHISPHPGYRCLTCGARLRGMTFTYLLAIALALGMLVWSTGLVEFFGAGDERNPLWREYLWAIPLCLLVVGYPVFQLLHPRPRKDPNS